MAHLTKEEGGEAHHVTRPLKKDRSVLVTGGAGFIGSNLIERLLQDPGTHVRLFDNLSRAGVAHNVRWLNSLPGADRLEVVQEDIRNAPALVRAAEDVGEIYHLAAQVAVTTSVDQPRPDFEVNALGTFNVLEAARRSGRRPFLLFTSTNKVYGALHSVPVQVDGLHYRAATSGFRGVNEQEALDFHSPYGCSKGAADQYVRDYARIYDIPTVVFRMSCIAGPRQFGNEDQGWVAHFLYRVLEGEPITIYGDGYQVRDVLHVSDLIEAMELSRLKLKTTSGQIYNVGGGINRSVSVREMLADIENILDRRPKLLYRATRPGDQPLYISDTAKLTADTGWRQTLSLTDTLTSIHSFWHANRNLLRMQRSARPTELVPEEVA